MGERKRPGISAAIRGGLVNGLITDELTALALTAT
jgi:DNA-binding transcriptional regulator LsrR (DeoR family)